MVKRKTKKKTTKGRKIVQSKPTKFNETQFASELERDMYIELRRRGIKCAYEGKTYVTLEEFHLEEDCFERSTRKSKQMINRTKVTQVTYTPDFVGENEEWIIECKGRANESFPLRWKLFKLMTSKWEKPPIIFKPMNKQDCVQVAEILKSRGYGKS